MGKISHPFFKSYKELQPTLVVNGKYKYRELNRRTEIDYFYSTIVGEVFYSKGHSHCKGYPGSIGNDPMDQLLVTESLTVVNKEVTI